MDATTESRGGECAALGALALATIATAGGFLLWFVGGFKPCPLCFYQRTFAMALLALFGIGRLQRVPAGTLGALGLPMVLGGLGVAGFHVWLEGSGTLDCPPGLLGIGTSPQQSLAVYLPLAACVVAAATGGRARAPVLGAGAALGLVLAGLSCFGNGPLPPAKPPTLGPDGKRILVICEPHWTPPADGPAPAPASK